MPIVRFFDGSLVHFEEVKEEDENTNNDEKDEDEKKHHLHQQVVEYLGDRDVSLELFPNTEGENNEVDYFAIIHPSREVMILNRTQGNYFLVERDRWGHLNYTYELNGLFGQDDFGRWWPGHWAPSDHIIVVPTHLHTYVKWAYGRLDVS